MRNVCGEAGVIVNRTGTRGAIALTLAAGLMVVGPLPALAESNASSSALVTATTFFVYSDGDDHLELSFGPIGGNIAAVTVTSPDGVEVYACTAGLPTVCTRDEANDGRLPLDAEGVWTVSYDSGLGFGALRHTWTLLVHDGPTDAAAELPGRVWVEQYDQYQNAISTQNYWVVTREGYRYAFTLNNFNGIGSSFRANGFGLVEEGTCTPIYRSAEGTVIESGVALEPGVAFSGPECGDAYKIFFASPAADLPSTAQSARGTEWILNPVTTPGVTGMVIDTVSENSWEGSIVFTLAGINGGYEIQLDVDGNGVFTDEVDRTIPWGSPPGAVSVPFDGLDGLGQPLAVCEPISGRVAVERVGEVHFVLEDVETLTGVNLQGVTPGITAPSPLLYWDDRSLSAGPAPTPVIDGRAGVNASSFAAHGWPGGVGSWGDRRSIENWSFYEASIDEVFELEAPCAQPAEALPPTGADDAGLVMLAALGLLGLGGALIARRSIAARR